MIDYQALYGKEYFESSYQDKTDWSIIARILVDNFGCQSVLELGCADGKLIRELMKKGVDALGIEVSEYAVSKATTAIRKLIVNERIITGIDKITPGIDLVFSKHVLEHLVTTDIPVVFEKVFNILKVRGWFVNIIDLSGLHPEVHFSNLDRQKWIDFIVSAGFDHFPDMELNFQRYIFGNPANKELFIAQKRTVTTIGADVRTVLRGLRPRLDPFLP